jgi:non-canonical purine NTP pyrophosphatase (RdgB/HAM1 family)
MSSDGNRQPPPDATQAEALLVGVALVTGNRNKLEEARRLCGVRLEAVELDLPEIQSLDIKTVLEAKAREAYRRLQRPLIVEETGLELSALNGFPGPLIKWLLAAVGADGISRLAMALADDRAIARCCLLLYRPDRTLIAEGKTEGRLVLPARGSNGFGWDPVFIPHGETRTYGELSPEEKDRFSHRGEAWRQLVARLQGA